MSNSRGWRQHEWLIAVKGWGAVHWGVSSTAGTRCYRWSHRYTHPLLSPSLLRAVGLHYPTIRATLPLTLLLPLPISLYQALNIMAGGRNAWMVVVLGRSGGCGGKSTWVVQHWIQDSCRSASKHKSFYTLAEMSNKHTCLPRRNNMGRADNVKHTAVSRRRCFPCTSIHKQLIL